MELTPADVLAWARAAPPRFRGLLPVGSFCLDVHAEDLDALAALAQALRLDPERRPAPRRNAADADAVVHLVGAPAGGPLFPNNRATREENEPAVWTAHGPALSMLYTGWMRLLVDRRRRPHRIAWIVRRPQYSEAAFRDHLFALLSKLLFTYGRFYLHAAAVEQWGRVSLFVGPGGHGKSTVCLRLARSGATVLSEDHVLLRRDGAGFLVSGCQDTFRVTAKTEAALFERPLEARAVESAQGTKKEAPLGAHFASRPFVDHPIDRVLFTRVGVRLAIAPLPPQEAMLRLIRMTRSFFRPDHADDLDAWLGFFRDLAASVSSYDLELSPDLASLDRFEQTLSELP